MRTTPLILVVLLLGCSDRITVRVDYDRSYRVTDYHTFSWLESKQIESRNQPLIINELNDKRIKELVGNEMSNAGYTLSPTGSELILHYHIVVEEKQIINPSAYGYSYGSYWFERKTDTYYYRQGTIIIDIMDASNKQLLWRGWAFSVLDEQPYLSEESLNNSIRMIFEKFPSLDKEAKKKAL